MAGLKLKNINKVYPNGFHAVHDVNLEINDKEFMVFVGPSGCGKTTTLRMIAGLEDISDGELYIGDRLVNDIEPKDRDIAMVFQNYALYPHMTVYENMAFGLKMRKVPKPEIEKRVQKASSILGLGELLERRPKQLSGGQSQRVALGRAIVRDPAVFLMDEPLSNLDAKLRVQMRAELIKLHHELKATIIYVTHDQTEAMTMGTRICVMNKGVVQQVDTPINIYTNPANQFVAGFIGAPQMNFLDAALIRDGDNYTVVYKDIAIPVCAERAEQLSSNDIQSSSVVLGIRPEDVIINNNDMPCVESTIDVTELLGSEVYVYINLDGKNVIVKTDNTFQHSIGDKIKLSFKPNKIHIFDKNTEKSLFY